MSLSLSVSKTTASRAVSSVPSLAIPEGILAGVGDTEGTADGAADGVGVGVAGA